MASIQVRKETGTLIIDFYYRGKRYREQTLLLDTPANRKRLEKFLAKMMEAIALGSFIYRDFFPSSKNAAKLEQEQIESNQTVLAQAVSDLSSASVKPGTPLFKEFIEVWYAEKNIEWRNSHKKEVRNVIDKRLIPQFGEMEVGNITKAHILAFRADLAKAPARNKQNQLSNPRINKILMPLRQVLNEAADRFDFRTPFTNIKQLKVKKSDVQPFSLDEVQRIIFNIRKDYQDYFTVRFFTGMRTGEINGLKWEYVDFDRRLIMVRETVVDGRTEYTKTDGSQRDIQMSQVVYGALRRQEAATRGHSAYVFCNTLGAPLDHKNVTNRVWYPLLRHLGLTKRRPYQCRHTCATLWLASGESPQWIAAQLGHTTTEMLFRVYARFVPNLTRKDGSAFERMLLQMDAANASPIPQADASPPSTNGESRHG
jgi:integrase